MIFHVVSFISIILQALFQLNFADRCIGLVAVEFLAILRNTTYLAVWVFLKADAVFQSKHRAFPLLTILK